MLLIICILQIAAQTPEERYAQAGQLYSSGDYSGAAAVYRKLFDDGYKSEDMLYNAGNAFFKSGDNASAILFYERARLIAPADEDINYNLQIARSRVTDKFEPVPELFFVRWFNFLSLLALTNTWAVAALLLFIASLVVCRYLSYKGQSQRAVTVVLAVIGSPGTRGSFHWPGDK